MRERRCHGGNRSWPSLRLACGSRLPSKERRNRLDGAVLGVANAGDLGLEKRRYEKAPRKGGDRRSREKRAAKKRAEKGGRAEDAGRNITVSMNLLKHTDLGIGVEESAQRLPRADREAALGAFPAQNTRSFRPGTAGGARAASSPTRPLVAEHGEQRRQGTLAAGACAAHRQQVRPCCLACSECGLEALLEEVKTHLGKFSQGESVPFSHEQVTADKTKQCSLSTLWRSTQSERCTG